MNKADDIKDHPYLIQSYTGFGNADQYFIKGRVLENEGALEKWSDSKLRNFWETLKRIDTDEIPGAEVSVKFGAQKNNFTADQEGFFSAEGNWNLFDKKETLIKGQIDLVAPEMPNAPLSIPCQVIVPSKEAKFGIISDVDDTVLQTHMTSRMKLRMMYVSFLQGAHQRLPMEGMKDLLQELCEYKDGKHKHPIFYVSNSPWNIYDVLSDFIEIQELPKGPLLLRDFGMNLIFKKENFVPHKLQIIRQIFNCNHQLPFICFGDTASNDADYYLQLAEEFPSKIKGIFIRETKNNRNAKRIRKLFETHENPNYRMIHTSQEIMLHVAKMNLM